MGGSTSFGTHIAENHLGTLFELCFGRVWDQMGQKCQYFAKYDQKCTFWAKLGCFTGGSKSFGTHVTKTYRRLVCIFFGLAWDQVERKSQYLAKSANFGAKTPYFCRGSKAFCSHISENCLRTSFALAFRSGMGRNGQERPIFGQKYQFLAQIRNLWKGGKTFGTNKTPGQK